MGFNSGFKGLNVFKAFTGPRLYRGEAVHMNAFIL